ncbi:hypothetical protein LWI28_011464 [Acer negundo]|uniref:Uncharacterized protein n=1 Tax=Acer negundo TaxID=4023 RepID=A0AAD5NF79_ACENE|nr:hypothetical protein LWI28_011464 [Acer negundo]
MVNWGRKWNHNKGYRTRRSLYGNGGNWRSSNQEVEGRDGGRNFDMSPVEAGTSGKDVILVNVTNGKEVVIVHEKGMNPDYLGPNDDSARPILQELIEEETSLFKRVLVEQKCGPSDNYVDLKLQDIQVVANSPAGTWKERARNNQCGFEPVSDGSILGKKKSRSINGKDSSSSKKQRYVSPAVDSVDAVVEERLAGGRTQ